MKQNEHELDKARVMAAEIGIPINFHRMIADLKDDILKPLEENLENIEKLKFITDQKVEVVGSDFGYRATTRDHLPLVGKTKGIFVNIGHGSRGLSSAPISAQFISDLISGSHPVFGKDVIKSLYPERFKGKA